MYPFGDCSESSSPRNGQFDTAKKANKEVGVFIGCPQELLLPPRLSSLVLPLILRPSSSGGWVGVVITLRKKETLICANGSVQQATIEMDSRWVNILSHLWVLRKDCTEPWSNSSLPKLPAFDLGLRHFFLIDEPRTVFMTMQNGVLTGSLHTLRCRFETTYSAATTLDQISFHPTCFDPFVPSN